MGGALVVSGQLALSPVVLAAGEACGAVPDGGLSTRRARDGKFPEEISDAGAPQGNSRHAGPDEGGARRAGAGTYNPKDSSQNKKSVSTDRAKRGPFCSARRCTLTPHVDGVRGIA